MVIRAYIVYNVHLKRMYVKHEFNFCIHLSILFSRHIKNISVLLKMNSKNNQNVNSLIK